MKLCPRLIRMLVVPATVLLSITAASGQIYNFKVYTSSTGLPNNSIYSIFQDSKGYIWFGTDAGMCRYDGAHFTTYSIRQGLPDASVRSIFQDKQGWLWITTKGGVSRWDGTQFTTFNTTHGLLDNEVRVGLPSRKGGIWFGTSKGLSYYDGKSFRNYSVKEGLSEGPVWGLLEDSRGTLWIALRGGGLASFDGEYFTNYGDKTHKNVFGIVEDRSGRLWIATDDGLVRYDGKTFTYYRKEQGLGSNLVSSVLVDDQDRVWCGTFGGGVCRLDEDGFKVFDRKHGLPDNYITSMSKDFEGNVWFGTLWSGACRFSSEQFSNYTGEAGIVEGLISSIAESKTGEIWLSSINSGIAVIEPQGSVRRIGVAEGLMQEGIWALFIDSRDRVWAGGQKGVSCYEKGRFKHYTLAEMGARERITSIAEDGKGRLWFTSNSSRSNGIISYDGKTFKLYSTAEGLVHNQVSLLALDRQKRLWVCTEGGISRFDDPGFTNYTTAHGLPSKRTLCFVEDTRGRYWVGTSDGLALLEGNRFRVYRVEDGLVDNFISSLTTSNETLWIGTSRGISAYNGKSFRNYTVKDGLISNDVYIGASLTRADGTVWFGTMEGVVCYNPGREPPKKMAPRIVIEGAEVQTDQEFIAFSGSGDISLNHNENNLRFHFAGLSYVDEEAVEYSYKLQGYDSDWSRPIKERTVRFTNLPPGQYRFYVKAKSLWNLWSEPASMQIEISEPFWQRWWFVLICVGTFFTIAYLFSIWRVRRMERLHKRRIKEMGELFDSVSLINSQLDLQTVLQSIAEEGARLIGGETGGIGLVQGDKVVFNRTWTGKEWDYRKIEFPIGKGVAGLVAQTGKALIVNDPENDPRLAFKDLVSVYKIHGFIDVPIINRKGDVVGVLDVRRKASGSPLGASDQQLLEALAHQAAIAIENADLYTTLAESNHMLEQLYKNEQEVSRTLQELNRMKNNFMAVTSHEMRTPLTVLKGYHEMLMDGYLGELTPRQKASIEKCYNTVERMITNLNDILEMIKSEDRQFHLRVEPLDIANTIGTVLDQLRPFLEKRRQTIEIQIDNTIPAVIADRDKLQLVLLNLIQNAIKFTPDEGTIQIEVRTDDENVRITIKDNGIGINKSELVKIFDKFYTSIDALNHTSGKYEFMARGAGLGLAIVKSYVEAHGGRVWAESDGSGKGSCFIVVLPCRTEQPVGVVA